MQGKGTGQDDFGGYRFQLAYMAYALALTHRHSARSGSRFATRTRGSELGSQSRSNKEFLRFAIPLTSSR